MDPEAKEAAMKEKLDCYLVEAFKMGTLRGFQHFYMYLRGKEEMTLTVYHEPQISSRRCSILHNPTEISVGESLTASQLPYDKQTLVLSQGTQMKLSGLKDKGVGLPPASPSDNEQSSASNTTVFLIAGYSRYSCPYVWVRSNHQRLMKMSGAGDGEKDHPLRLKSTSRWKHEEVHIWEIIAELVKLCMYPTPRNPFAVDMKYFLSLSSTHQQVLASAAMMQGLQKIAMNSSDEKPYLGKVLEDLLQVSRLHYSALLSLVTSQRLPVAQQRAEERERKSSGGGKRRTLSGGSRDRDRYPSGGQQTAQWGRPGDMTVQSTQGVYTTQGSSKTGFPGYGFTPAPSLF
ncbi:uncharacterized protein LOC143288888 [Babylonia areolata]|uniref:uncharacterized protein LOC143288888 n=1 Tax=Babylonia areolata TaxID=304850 RepID=UPI003FD183DA